MSHQQQQQQQQDLDMAISDTRRKLFNEEKILNATKVMRTRHTNRNAIAELDSSIYESQRRIQFLQDQLAKLSLKKQHRDSVGSNCEDQRSLGASSSSATVTAERPRSTSISKLDLRRSTSSLSTQKVSLKLHELAYKLEVERKLLEGTNRISSIYVNDYMRGNKKKMAQVNAASSVISESREKVLLLERAFKKYQSLYINYIDDDDEGEEAHSGYQLHPGLKRPLSGKLQLKILAGKYMHRVVSSQTGKFMGTFVRVKIDGIIKATTRMTNIAEWNEYFEFAVNKASEVELSVYDRYDRDYLLGMMWVKLSDLHEEVRKQQAMAESADGWAPADQIQKGIGITSSAGGVLPGRTSISSTSGPFSPGGGSSSSTTAVGQATPLGSVERGVRGTWDIEPSGQLELWFNFTKDTPRRRQQSKLGRKAAVKKQKGRCTEMMGHHFFSHHTYTIMKCTICEEHIVNSVGLQCEDCLMFVHDRCVSKVVTRCLLSDSATTIEDATDLINHRIPHRFEPSTMYGANCCSHCGSMLPIGRRALKCHECNMVCHTDCARFIPNFCGMKMTLASQVLEQVKRGKGAAVPQPKVLDKRETIARRGRQQQQQPASPQLSQTQHTDPKQLPILPPIDTSALGGAKIPTQPYGAPSSQPVYPHNYQQQQHTATRTDARPPVPAGAHSPELSYYQQHMRQRKQQSPAGSSTNLHQMGGQRLSQLYTQPSQQPVAQQPLPSPSTIPPQLRSGAAVVPPPSSDGVAQVRQPFRVERPEISEDAKALIRTAMQQGFQPQKQPQQEALPPAVPKKDRKVTLDDFKFLTVLGKGNFGKVILSEEKKTGSLYAIKVLKKQFIAENEEFESTKSEKRVLLIANRERHPFLIGLHSCFQNDTRLFFVMEYVSGGDLMMHIQTNPFSEARAKFYACEVLLALEYFHSNDIIYRDLKLDNILLAADGHIKLADYGLCKENMGYGATTNTFCGTPEFLAPQIILEQRYGREVDWWAFGVLIYEMLLAQSPFRGEDEDEIFDAILEDEILYPMNMSRDSVSICKELMERDPVKRLGSGPNDAQDVKRHPFFKGCNWDDFLNKRVKPPFIPVIKSPTDTSNFDAEFTSEKPRLTPSNTVISPRDQREFADFDYVAPWAV
ncbi:Serine/threonine kinase [Spiromyces aspiralis]|uniref:Serine/threonine kinase n=1 Tax=Spiromyces aspiralis TaxID=68401 RepID=A0ACC1HKJ8_9FUNG|nr:Serine/threonine kinase [Spiromyces aspiralis]